MAKATSSAEVLHSMTAHINREFNTKKSGTHSEKDYSVDIRNAASALLKSSIFKTGDKSKWTTVKKHRKIVAQKKMYNGYATNLIRKKYSAKRRWNNRSTVAVSATVVDADDIDEEDVADELEEDDDDDDVSDEEEGVD